MDPSKPDRVIVNILHEESDGSVCVSTGALYAFKLSGKEWLKVDHLKDSLVPKGPCTNDSYPKE